MNTNTQARIMRTYEVHLGVVVETVNLSYELNDALEAVDRDGEVVTGSSLRAKIEVMKRLRKLAERERTTVTPGEIDESDWDVRMVRTRFVQVPVDESGQPIPHQP